jgi:hypothetical protein
MVLENLFPRKWVEKKLRYAVLIAFVYSSISILISVLLFGKNSGLISVFLTSLLILPLLDKLLAKDEKREEKEKKFSLQHLYKDNKEVVVTYLFLFVGIFFTYAFYVFTFKFLGINVIESFQGQLLLDFSKGGATFIFKDFWTIFANNWWVLLTIFLIALFIRNGAIFFIAWNASSWGVILSYRAITSAAYTGNNSFKFFLIVLALSLPFLLLEAFAYILAAVSGDVMSQDVVKKSKYVKSFIGFSAVGIAVYFVLHQLIVMLKLGSVFSILLQVVMVLLILFLVSKTIKEKKNKEVFLYNYYLFIVAIIVFVLGALLEILITSNVDILTKIYSTSLLFSLPI